MNRSYLIVNSPRSCFTCKFGFDYDSEIRCFLDSSRNIEDPYNEIPKWCRLREFPNERIYKDKDNPFMQGCVIGWNDLMKILLNRNY